MPELELKNLTMGSVVSVVLCLFGILVLKIDLQWVLLGGIALTIIIARFMYKTGIIKNE